MVGHTTKFWPMKSKRKPMENFLEEFFLPCEKCNGRSPVFIPLWVESHEELVTVCSCCYIVTVWTWQRDLQKSWPRAWHCWGAKQTLTPPPLNLCCAKWLNVVILIHFEPEQIQRAIRLNLSGMEYKGKASKRRWLTLAHQLFRENGAHMCFWQNDKWWHFYGLIL